MAHDLATDINLFREEAARLDEAGKALYQRLQQLVGMRVKILCPNYNGQPCGRSKPPLKGKVFTVRWAFRDNKSIRLAFDEHAAGIAIEDVMFIEDKMQKEGEDENADS